MIWKIRYSATPAHVRCAIFCGKHAEALANCGTLTLRWHEFAPFVMAMQQLDPIWLCDGARIETLVAAALSGNTPDAQT